MTAPTSSVRETLVSRKWAMMCAAAALAIPVILHSDAVIDARAEVPAARDAQSAPVYYLPSQLDKRPHLLTRVDPAYPRIAPLGGGQVVLRLFLSEEGRVERMVVVKSDPPVSFDKAAMDAFRDAHYSSALIAGAKVKSQITIEVTFHPILPPGAK